MSTHHYINGYYFTLNDDGTVNCKDIGNLGHLEDCEAIAGILHEFFEALEATKLH